jgi:ABC-type Fe3+-siderophore transport system permease subunit
MNFEAVCAWKKASGDARVYLRNPSFQMDIIGVVSGSTWFIALMYFPLALAMTRGNIIDTHHMSTAGLNGMQIGSMIGAFIGSAFGRGGFVLGGFTESLMGIITGFTSSYLERH